ncbi:hypothetical protein AYI69_g10750 [Smittium culicis]|uniref:Uncharacterized protein n=1 Tax=Smittium culicis TaxID=133412 RepID=A0A1R1X3Q1_9FUNG|nr:hypothetical protein AYI69_g10750 [Smittium culicis]
MHTFFIYTSLGYESCSNTPKIESLNEKNIIDNINKFSPKSNSDSPTKKGSTKASDAMKKRLKRLELKKDPIAYAMYLKKERERNAQRRAKMRKDKEEQLARMQVSSTPLSQAGNNNSPSSAISPPSSSSTNSSKNKKSPNSNIGFNDQHLEITNGTNSHQLNMAKDFRNAQQKYIDQQRQAYLAEKNINYIDQQNQYIENQQNIENELDHHQEEHSYSIQSKASNFHALKTSSPVIDPNENIFSQVQLNKNKSSPQKNPPPKRIKLSISSAYPQILNTLASEEEHNNQIVNARNEDDDEQQDIMIESDIESSHLPNSRKSSISMVNNTKEIETFASSSLSSQNQHPVQTQAESNQPLHSSNTDINEPNSHSSSLSSSNSSFSNINQYEPVVSSPNSRARNLSFTGSSSDYAPKNISGATAGTSADDHSTTENFSKSSNLTSTLCQERN